MKATGSLIVTGIATFALALANVANAEEPVKLSSAEMDSVTAGSYFPCCSVNDIAIGSNLTAVATATAAEGSNVAVGGPYYGGNVYDSGDTTADADASNF